MPGSMTSRAMRSASIIGRWCLSERSLETVDLPVTDQLYEAGRQSSRVGEDAPEAIPPVRPTTVSCEQADTIRWH